MPDGRAKIVIVGAGFGGIEAAKSLRRAGRGHRDRPAESSLLPAAALPSRDRGALSGRRGLADPPHSAQAEERDGANGRSPRR
jgi:choline dehydrogenase-like flavoprotein